MRATVDNNLRTTIYCVRAALPHMVSRGHGRIVNIGADSVRTGLMDHAMYNAAKGAPLRTDDASINSGRHVTILSI